MFELILDTTEEFSDRGSVHIDETVDGLTLGQISNDRIHVLNIVLTFNGYRSGRNRYWEQKCGSGRDSRGACE